MANNSKIKIKGYSERGVIDALVYSMYEHEELAKEFINLLVPEVTISESDKITFYVEQSLSDFGDPDLMILIGKEKNPESLIFVEAKVKTWSNNWSLETEWKKFNDCRFDEKNKRKLGKNTSNLFRQLRMKKELMEHIGEVKLDGYRIPDARLQGTKNGKRKIGSNGVVQKAFADISKVEKDSVYYAAIVPDSCENLEKFKNDTEDEFVKRINFVSWACIEKIFVDNKDNKDDKDSLIKIAFEHNKGQIY